MDNLSHSRLPNRGSTSLSKKTCNGSNGGGAYVAQTIYDDVYGGPPKFGVSALSPRFEDYGEIFGSFHALRASSIPILDLPAVDETEVFFDARSSAFDYAEVFGGFDGLDFAISYEELVNPSKSADDGSSDDAWTRAGTESLSDCSDHSGKSHCMSNGDSNHSSGGSTEFCISYNKVNPESNGNISNGKTHVTQLEVLPGFSYLVDEANPSPKGTDDDPSLQTNDDSYLNIDFNTGKVKGKHSRNTMPPPLDDSNGCGQSLEDNLISQNGYGRVDYRSHEDFMTVSEISLRTDPSQVPPPSRPPPKFAVKKGDYIKMTSNCSEAASEVILDDHSRPLFDVEVDASSSAAASAAAMKEAMEKAQAQLQNAKDLWERKKEGVHGRVRLDAKNDVKEKEGNLTKIPNQFTSLTNERVQGISKIHDYEMELPAREERQKGVKETEVCSTPYGAEELLTVAEMTKPNRNGSRCLVSEDYDCCGEWKEATEFFELARTDISTKEFESMNNDKISNFLTGQMGSETIIEAWKNENEGKPFQKARVLHKEVKNVENMVHGKEEDKIKPKPRKHETGQREQVKLKFPQGVCDLEENDKKFGVVREFVEAKKQMSGAGTLEKHEKPIEFKQLENELKVEQPVSPKDIVQKKKKVVKRKENENILEESHREEGNENRMEEVIENEKQEKLLLETSEREKLEQRMRMVLEQQENKKRLNMVLEEEENLKGQIVSERQLEGVPEMEDHGQREKEADKVGVGERFKLAHERVDDDKWSKKNWSREECEIGVEDSFQTVNTECTPRNSGKYEETKMLVKDSQESAELKGTSKEHDETERLKERQKVNSTAGTQVYMEMEDLGISSGAFQIDDDKNHLATRLACSMGMSQEFAVLNEYEERNTRVTANGSLSKNGGIEDLQFNKSSYASSMCPPEVEHHQIPVKTEDANIPLSLDEWTKKAGKETSFQPKPAERINMEDAILSENSTSMDEEKNEIHENLLKKEDMKASLPLDRSDETAGQADIAMEQVPVGRTKFVTRMDSDPEHQERKLFCCMEDKAKSFDQVEEKEQKVSVQGVKARAQKGSGTEKTQPTISERIQKNSGSAHEVNTNQATERKGKIVNQGHTSKGRENERVRSEAEFENDILKKMEEEREREREREKDRMPIDRIAVEPRDRVAAEARERAEIAALERMTAEARQRALAEARERLEKACADARENSLAGKATMEARIKAERAAVERATAEARERAVEKATSDRNSFGVRDRIERSVSDKFSVSSRNNEMRQKSSSSGQPSLQSQSFGSSIGPRYAYYSAYDERNEGVDGESPQRCKARFERHQRTAERAAKALAEKNMRDLLAQREHAERNRLAETLDADVRRWSSGKEGNLRALLSTLQYILGPDSGWQPIPLTEVITAAAVKKAYRKATLCVHPDKLQQRGASIQQKYICEKVFDLLKEAWNKFNSEER